MKKFNVEVSRIDEYIVEIDETVWNEEFLAEWAETFFEFDDLEDLAKHISFLFLRFGHGEFFEGFGHIETYRAGSDTPIRQFKGSSKVEKFCPGIRVTIICEDNDFDYSVIEK